MGQRLRKLAGDEIVDADEADQILERLADLMHRATSPTLRAVLLEAAEEIAELLNEDGDEDTEIDIEREAA